MSFDIKEIKKQFDEVIRYSQGIENPKTEELFNRFLDAKRDFIELFGGNLIYEYPYVLHLKLDKKEKQKNLNNCPENKSSDKIAGWANDIIT